MLSSGDYKIQNALYDYRFVHMQHTGKVVGYSDGDVIELVVKDKVLGLGTLFDKKREKYIVIDKETGCVVGSLEPQVLQFSTEGDGKYTIHRMDINEVWVINADKGLDTPIYTAPAPPSSAPDYGKNHWIFVEVFDN